MSRSRGSKAIRHLMSQQQEQHPKVKICDFWLKYGNCRYGDKCRFLHPNKTSELSEEQKKEIAEEYNEKTKEEARKRRERLSTCGHVKKQNGSEKGDSDDGDMHGQSERIHGCNYSEEDDVYGPTESY